MSVFCQRMSVFYQSTLSLLCQCVINGVWRVRVVYVDDFVVVFLLPYVCVCVCVSVCVCGVSVCA